MTDVYVGIGSNIDRRQNIQIAVGELQQLFGKLDISSAFESEAIGVARGRFYNLVVGLSTTMNLEQIRSRLREIETLCGRDRNGQSDDIFALDLDILLFGDFIGSVLDISLPRSDVRRFAFVLCPLAEIAGWLRHPVSGETYQYLWDRFDKSLQPLKRVELILPETYTSLVTSEFQHALLFPDFSAVQAERR